MAVLRIAVQFLMILSSLAVAAAIDEYQFNPFEQRDISRDVNGVPFTAIRNLTVGQSCRWNYQCTSGCCLESGASSKGRQCGDLGAPGRSCSTTNLKGGYFLDACPCIDPKGCVRPETSRVGECRKPMIDQDVTIISTTIRRITTTNTTFVRP